ncbi:hypothetical protein ACFCX4_25295, partial [Kitasatospora sp. NPDC056327]|uniref:hypothetical protein n=1 Tax=Kitasatospora sp. NPDC056327 TaxID=3345785 RepID=UPI0035DBACF0
VTVVTATTGVVLSGPDATTADRTATPALATAAWTLPSFGSPEARDILSAEWQLNLAGHSGLLHFLRTHPLPGGAEVREGRSPSYFLLERTNAPALAVTRQAEGRATSAERANPCSWQNPGGGSVPLPDTECHPVPLTDGWTGWVLGAGVYGSVTRHNQILVISPAGDAVVLDFAPLSGPRTPDPAVVSLDQLRALAAAPGFAEALTEGWQTMPSAVPR